MKPDFIAWKLMLASAWMITLLSFSASVARAHQAPVPDIKEFGTAVVDGVIEPGEYGSSCRTGTEQAAGFTYVFTFCHTNDTVNNYYAFSINDGFHDDADDMLKIYIDNEHDGVIATGTADAPCPFSGSGSVEDLITFQGAEFRDEYYCQDGGDPPFLFYTNPDSVFHGTGARVFTDGVGTVYELSHPLDSGDPDDYALSPGDTIGYCVLYRDSKRDEIEFPAGCFEEIAVTATTTETFADIAVLGPLDDNLKKLLDVAQKLWVTRLPIPAPNATACVVCTRVLLPTLERAYDALTTQGREDGAKLAIRSLQQFLKRAVQHRDRIDAAAGPGATDDLMFDVKRLIDDLHEAANTKG